MDRAASNSEAYASSPPAMTPISTLGRGAALVGGAVILVAGLALVWYTRQVLLLGFAGILLAVLLKSLADIVARYSGLSFRWSLAAVLWLLATFSLVAFWSLGQRIAEQASEVTNSLPQSIAQLRQQLKQYTWGQWIVDQVPQEQSMFNDTDMFSQVTGIASSAAGFFAGVAVVLFVGIYGAVEPRLYLEGMVRLVPIDKRPRCRIILETVGYNLRWWLWGQLATMCFVGLMVGLGLWLLGIPQALALGLLAFGMDIIPNVGPVIAAIPGLLLAWTQGTTTLLWALALYCGVQMLEGYILLPLIHRQTVWLPPALGLLAILFFGLIGGLIGVFVAAPLMVALMTIVKMLYVEDVLGDRSIDVPGEPD